MCLSTEMRDKLQHKIVKLHDKISTFKTKEIMSVTVYRSDLEQHSIYLLALKTYYYYYYFRF